MKSKSIQTKHGEIRLPAFMPDATYGSIKSVSFEDTKKTGIEAIVTTTLHIEQKIGSLYIKQMGGIHKFFGWNRPILTDSGGWQVFSLINAKGASASSNFITEVGCSFIDPENGSHALLTPESSMQIQWNLGADIMTVLDDPILGNASLEERKKSVELNTKWAKRARKKFDELSKTENDVNTKPLLGCVIQGADDFQLRKQSAEELVEIGFDIFNFGGIPLKNEATWKKRNGEVGFEGFYHDMLEYVAKLIPEDKLKYAMGVGQPIDIAFCVDVGWDLFDTVLPTRNARHGYLYVSEGQGEETKTYKNLNHDILRLKPERYKFDQKPVDENCDCECCRTVSRAYLRHLIRINEPAGFRLASIHNLRFYAKWMEEIKKQIK
jgi:queuine tRNA-ribosyltransferase